MEYRDLTTQKVSLSTTSAQSSAISDSVYKIRLIATANVHFKIGVNPTATDSDALGGVAAASYLRADTNDTTAGTLGV